MSKLSVLASLDATMSSVLSPRRHKNLIFKTTHPNTTLSQICLVIESPYIQIYLTYYHISKTYPNIMPHKLFNIKTFKKYLFFKIFYQLIFNK